MNKLRTAGHLGALLSSTLWGTTFISTKVLLREFTPVEILVLRFVVSYLVLWLVCPKWLKVSTWRQELLYAAAGFTGVTSYYLLENISLTYTTASNVGVIASFSPFFAALISYFLLRSGERLGGKFYAGFVMAMTGICLVSLQGGMAEVHPLGDFIALLGAAVWAVYSVLLKKVGEKKGNPLLITRRIFFYGIVGMLPMAVLFGFNPDLGQVVQPVYASNLLYLGVGAGALCFVSWRLATEWIGPVRTCAYLYLCPVVAVVTASLVLGEKVGPMGILGIVLTLAGLICSEQTRNRPVPNKLDA